MEMVELLKKSLDKNEVDKLLMGFGEYHTDDKWTELPTDLSEVFLQGFNKYVEISGSRDNFLNDKIHEALLSLLKEPIGTWWVVSILYSYLFGYQKGALLFDIDSRSLMPSVEQSFLKFSEDLQNEKAWVGWRFPNGLIDDLSAKICKIKAKLDESE